MSSSILYTIVPSVLFFLPTFLIFSMLELFIVEVVERLEIQHQDAVMTWVKSIEEHHHKVILAVELVGVALVGVSLSFVIPAVKTAASNTHVSIFSVFILLAITLIYFALTHGKSRLQIRKRGDKILYFILSVLLYAFVLLTVHKNFPAYENFINKNIVDTTVGAISKTLDSERQDKLLTTFRGMIKMGQCPTKDYRNEPKGKGTRHFVKMATDADLALPDATAATGGIEDALHGRVCTTGADTFLLTDEGVWYWVIVK